LEGYSNIIRPVGIPAMKFWLQTFTDSFNITRFISPAILVQCSTMIQQQAHELHSFTFILHNTKQVPTARCYFNISIPSITLI
jgi:hypothetical protein